jgi:glycogen operon protein
LNDLVSYNDKHNEANGEDNKDGHTDNRSWNCGVEGPTEDPEIIALRERQKRNLLTTLLLSQGTPMLLAGDEFGRTQHGNNNAYAQDNEISWVHWNIDQAGEALMDYVRRLLELRSHYPILRRTRFLTGEYNPELDVKDVTWINANGSEMQEDAWRDENTRCFGMLMDGRAQVTGIRQRGNEATLLLVLNAHHDIVQFTLPECPGGDRWQRLIDTNSPDSEPIVFKTRDQYEVTARSSLLFALKADPASL